MPKLKNDRQEMFCRYYLEKINGKKFNGTAAAIKAGYSKRSARTLASRMLINDNIQSRIAELSKKAFSRNDIDVDYLLKKYKNILDDEITNYLDIKPVYEQIDGRMYKVTDITVKDLSNVDTWNIKKIAKGKDGQFALELHDKQKALHDLMEYMNLFKHDDDEENNEDQIIDNFSPLLKMLTDYREEVENVEEEEDNDND